MLSLALSLLCSPLQQQASSVSGATVDTLGEYAGTYQWSRDSFIYLQLWSELTGTPQLTAFDESGDVRVLFPSARDTFFVGHSAAVRTAVEATIAFQRDSAGRITSLSWRRLGVVPRVAQRVDIERHEDVLFSNGTVRLAGTLITPRGGIKHPALVLVHGSGVEDREYILPHAHFLVRHGIAVLGYDKRGVGGSTGDWRTATFEDLASDVVAAVAYLRTRPDIDTAQIGLLGVSQAGWVMPLAAVRDPKLAFLISISGPGLPAAETTIDEARNEMTASGMPPETIDRIIHLMELQYAYARTGDGWDAYAVARDSLVARFGRAPETFPAARDDPYWDTIRRLYFYDPAPTLRRLRADTRTIR